MPHPSMFATSDSADLYVQVPVIANAPAWLYSTNASPGGDGNSVGLSLWFEFNDLGVDQFIYDAAGSFLFLNYEFSVWIDATGALRIFILGGDVIRVDLASGAGFFTDGVYYNLIISGSSAGGDMKAYANDSDLPLTGTDDAGSWDIQFTSEGALLADRNQANPLTPNLVDDIWLSWVLFDLDEVDDRRKFITATGKPADLGPAGELPLEGTAQDQVGIYFGNDYTAAGWNSGLNLGASAGNFNEGSAGWDSFQDVPPP